MAIFYNLEMEAVNGTSTDPTNTAALNFSENSDAGLIIAKIKGFDAQEDLSKVIFTPDTSGSPPAPGDDFGRYGVKWDAGFNSWVVYLKRPDGDTTTPASTLWNFEDKNGPSNVWKNTIQFSVGFQAGYTPKADYGLAFTFNIQNVNEAVTAVNFGTQSTITGGTTQAGVNVVKATWVDPDTLPAFRTNKYAFLVNGNLVTTDGKFSIVETGTNAGQITTNDAITAADGTFKDLVVVAYDAVTNTLQKQQAYRINIAQSNQPPSAPTVNGVTAVTINENAAFSGTLSATDETPAASLIYSFDTTQAGGGNAGGLFTIVNNQLQVAANALNFEGTNSYTVYVRANDGSLTGATQAITVTVGDVNEAPTNVTFSNAQAVQAGTTKFNAQVVQAAAVDPDVLNATFRNNHYKFADTGGTVDGSGLFTINAVTGVITTTRDVTFADVGQKTLNVIAYDSTNGALASTMVGHTFTILTAPPSTPKLNGGIAVSVNENATFTGTLSATDDATLPANLTYSFDMTQAGGGDANGMFTIVNNELQLATNKQLNYEALASGQAFYTVYVKAFDGTSFGQTQAFTINVNDLNEAPTNVTFGAQQNTIRAGSTGSDVNLVVATWTDQDTAQAFKNNKFAFLFNGTLVTSIGKFSIDDMTGQIKTNAQIDVADAGAKTLTVVAYDEGNNALRFTKDYAFNIVAAAAAPVVRFDQGSLSIAKDEGTGTGATAYTFTLTRDVNQGVSAVHWMLNHGTTEASDFSGPLSGDVTFQDGQSAQTITVLVNKDSSTELDETFTINITPVNNATVEANATAAGTVKNDDHSIVTNAPPTGLSLSLNAPLLSEYAVPGKDVVGTLSATDANGDALTYKLLDNAGGRFAIDGNKLVLAGPGVNFEDVPSHQIKVEVSDGKAKTEQVFTIGVKDETTVTWRGTKKNDNKTGSPQDDFLRGGVGTGKDKLYGKNGDDKLYGESGNDSVWGGDGIDSLYGGNGKDLLKGDADDDILYGEAGNDQLYGGSGKDIFVFNKKPSKATNLDKIMDFNVADDTIWLENKIFTKLGNAGSEALPAALSAASFVTGSKARDSKDFIIYDKKKGILYYDADGSGSRSAAVEIATIKKNLKLTADDFKII